MGYISLEMQDSKLIEIIRTFSEKEMKSFEKFINSSYFARGRDVSGLYNQLVKFYPLFDSPKLKRTEIFKKLYPGEVFNEKKLKNITFDLTKLAEQFLVHNSLKTNEIQFERLLAYEFKKRKLDKPFLNTINSLEKKIADIPFDGRKAFKEKEEWTYLKEDFLFWKNEYDESITYRLQNTEYSILSFLVKFLQRMEDKVVITTRYNKEFSNPLFDSMVEIVDFEKLLSLLKEKKYPYTWLVEIYYYAYLCANKGIDNENNYQLLKKLFFENIDFFSHDERHILFSDLTYYCIIRKEVGNKYYSREEFEIYKKMLEHYSFTPSRSEYFHIVLFRNILMSSVAQGEHEWLEKFAHEYLDKLPPELRENMKHYAQAVLHFMRKEYNEVLECTHKISYDIFLYKLDVKNLLIKVYYELELFDQALLSVDAYKHFLSQNKEHTEIYHEHYGNFINLYTKLVKLKEKPDSAELDLLSKKIDSTEHLASRVWLKDKIRELANSKELTKF